MALATCTYTVKPMTLMGNKLVNKVKISVSAYGTDGITFTPAKVGLDVIEVVLGIVFRTVVANGPVVGIWDETNAVIKCHKSSNTDVDASTVFDVDVTILGT